MSRNLSEETTTKNLSGVTHRVRQLERRPGPPIPAVLFIKVFPDEDYPFADPVVAGDGMFVFACSQDMNEMVLTHVEGYVTTVSSSGNLLVQIRNVTQAADMLTNRIRIDSGELNSGTAAVAPLVDVTNDEVLYMDQISVDVDSAGTNAFGLGVILEFRRF